MPYRIRCGGCHPFLVLLPSFYSFFSSLRCIRCFRRAERDPITSCEPRFQAVKVCSGVFYSCAEKGGHHEPLLEKKFGIKV